MHRRPLKDQNNNVSKSDFNKSSQPSTPRPGSGPIISSPLSRAPPSFCIHGNYMSPKKRQHSTASSLRCRSPSQGEHHGVTRTSATRALRIIAHDESDKENKDPCDRLAPKAPKIIVTPSSNERKKTRNVNGQILKAKVAEKVEFPLFKKDEIYLEKLRQEHLVMDNILYSRVVRLRAARSMYAERHLPGLVTYLHKIQDDTLLVDVIPFLISCIKKDPAACAHVITLCCDVIDLLTSKFEDYIGKGLLFLISVFQSKTSLNGDMYNSLSVYRELLNNSDMLQGIKGTYSNGKIPANITTLHLLLVE